MHFQDELRKLKKVLGPAMKGTSFHTANLISQEVKKEMNDIKKEVTSVENKILQAVAANNAMIQYFTSDQAYENENAELKNSQH